MGRPGLHKHAKFKRLVYLLGEPESHVRGYLECMWDTAYENGDAKLGEATDVALVCHYPSKDEIAQQKFVDALASCGGKHRSGFIERDDDGAYVVHDLFDHAPSYVQSRAQREQERSIKKTCEQCGTPYQSSDQKSRFCDVSCRVAHHRGVPPKPRVTQSNGESALHCVTDEQERSSSSDPTFLRYTENEKSPEVKAECNADVTQCNGTPAPAPAPAPAPSIHKEDDAERVVDTLPHLFDAEGCPTTDAKRSTKKKTGSGIIFPVRVSQTSKATEWDMPAELLDELRQAFPVLNLQRVFEACCFKLRNGAVSKKTAKGMPKFLWDWLEREQRIVERDSGRSPQAGTSPWNPRRDARRQALREAVERSAREGGRS